MGKILQVDLSRRKAMMEDVAPSFSHLFIGGLGFNAKILFDNVGPAIEPYSAENMVIISPGSLCGIPGSAASRSEVTTKSPLTGIIGTGNFGGYWGGALRRAGFDSLVIHGASENPVYLWIENHTVELRDAGFLWGRDTFETTDMLQKELGADVHVLSIGQAGENLVKYATVVADKFYTPGRSHAGGVLGYKKCKAIAVRGNQKIPVHSPESFKDTVKQIIGRIKQYPGWEYRNMLGAGSFGTFFPNRAKDIKQYLQKGPKDLCCACPVGEPVGCTLYVDLQEGKYAGTKLLNASYTHYGEYMNVLGVDIRAAWKIKEMANRYGMDSNHRRNCYPFRLYQNGILTKADTDGLELEQGNADALLELMRKTAFREGIGNLLADGLVQATKELGRGSDRDLVAVKGAVATGTWDPREKNAYDNVYLGILTCPRGGDDLKNQHALVDFPGLPAWARYLKWDENRYRDWLLEWLDIPQEVKNRIFGAREKPRSLTDLDEAMTTVWYGNYTCAYDALGLCMWITNSNHIIGPTLGAQLCSAITGWDMSAMEFMKAGERIFNLMRAYIVREGMGKKDDHWPEIFYRAPLGGGNRRLSKATVERRLDEYYDLRGWDKKTGIPSREKLRELDLPEAVEALEDRF